MNLNAEHKPGDYVRSIFHSNYGIGTIRHRDLESDFAHAMGFEKWFVEWERYHFDGFSHYAHELVPISPLELLAKAAE